MKIRIKLLAGILLLFLISQGISMAVLYSVHKDYEITARNQEILLNDGREKRFYKQVNTIPGQDKKPMEQETMLISVFRRNMGGTAALYQGEREVYNRTPYEFSYEKTKVYIEKKPHNHPDTRCCFL